MRRAVARVRCRHIRSSWLLSFVGSTAPIAAFAANFGDAGVELGDRGWTLVGVGTVCAFAGAFLGVRYLKKATVGIVRAMVATLMLLIGAALVAGVLGS